MNATRMSDSSRNMIDDMEVMPSRLPNVHASASLSIEDIAALIDDLRNNDTTVKISAFRKLSLIAKALGPSRTREELIPYLNEFTDEEDAVLLPMAEELGHLVHFVGESEHSHIILLPLEALCNSDDIKVREKAIASAVTIIEASPEDSIIKNIIPFIRRLVNGDWPNARSAAAQLCHAVYPKLPANATEVRRDVRNWFVALCSDETPLVRRVACQNIGPFSSAIDAAAVKAELLAPFIKLSKDEQDSVKLLTVEACIKIARVCQPADNMTKLYPVAMALLTDKSWRVRYAAADKFCEMYNCFSSELKSNDLVDTFVNLLKDSEAEVRTAAAFRVGELAKSIGQQRTLELLIPALRQLSGDSSQHTRAALGSVIMDVASVLKKKDATDNLLQLFLQLLKDSNPEVRLNIISKLDVVNQVIGVDVLAESLLPAVIELAADKKWRVRLAIINHIPLLAKQVGHEFFETKLNQLSMAWLSDPVSSIRDAAIVNLAKLAEAFGVEWAVVHIIPKIIHLGTHRNYLFRITAVVTLAELSRTFSPEMTSSKLLPAVLGLLNDAVPNVRFNAVKSLATVAKNVPADAVAKTVLPSLQALLRTDTDPEVQYHGSRALQQLGARAS